MNEKYIAYPGKKFTVEWYFDVKGKSPALEYFEGLDKVRKNVIYHLFIIMGDLGNIRNIRKFRHEGNQIYVFKSTSDRFFCFFFEGSKIVITNAYAKDANKMPQREKEKALNTRTDYKQRCNTGEYYDE